MTHITVYKIGKKQGPTIEYNYIYIYLYIYIGIGMFQISSQLTLLMIIDLSNTIFEHTF